VIGMFSFRLRYFSESRWVQATMKALSGSELVRLMVHMGHVHSQVCVISWWDRNGLCLTR